MKLRNKLILSCAALAAVATTAVSTTFAWYTSNTEVKATGVSGKTYESDASVLMISTDDYNWGSKVNLAINPQNMVPVATDDAGTTFKVWDQSTNAVGTTAVANQDYITFDLYFKSGSTDSLHVYMKEFNLVNTTTSLPAKIKLNSTGLTGVTSTTYTVDMFRALTIDQLAYTTTERLASDAAYPTATADSTHTKVWDCQSLAGSDSLDDVTTPDAHAYYNAVKGLEAGAGAIDTSITNSETTRANLVDTSASGYDLTSWELGVTGAGSIVSTTASGALKVTFNIYLDGWDKCCFDACQGQTFTLDMVFGSAKVTS